jgi:fibronectin type 3 domain-containing protein
MPFQEIAMTPGFASLLIALALSPALVSFAGFPKVTTVEPDTGKVGDIVSVKGENLDKSSIGEVYLTDGSHDMKVQIAEQTATEIKFKVPENVKAGRYHILVLTADKKSLVEQPVVFTVE